MKKTEKYTFFWKSKLGQWNLLPFTDNQGITYNCAEQYMMAKKALLFNDLETYEKIMNEKNPSKQQSLGREVKNFNKLQWDASCTSIVYQGNMYKFEQNPELLKILLDTKNTILVEASPYDIIWGVGLGENNSLISDEKNWKGQNLLGYTLTILRDNYFLKNIK